MYVSELMSSALVRVTAHTPVETCALRMEHLGVRHLLLVDADGQLAGAVTDAMVMRHGTVFGGADETTARSLAVGVDVVVRPDDDLLAVLRLLVRTRQDFAAVVDDHGHPIGLVTEHDLLKVALLVVPDRLLVRDLATRPAITIDAAALASDALDLMTRNHIRHLPVTSTDETVTRVVSYRDLVAEDVRQGPMSVDDGRVGRLFTAKASDTLGICAARMLEHRVGCLPVLDGGRAVGIVTRRDLMDAAAAALEEETLFGSHDAGVGPPSPPLRTEV